MIQAGMHKHMAALKQLTHPEPVHGRPQGGMQKVVAEMQASVDAELADPARKHDPLVALDVHMLNAMKQAVAKSEGRGEAPGEGGEVQGGAEDRAPQGGGAAQDGGG